MADATAEDAGLPSGVELSAGASGAGAAVGQGAPADQAGALPPASAPSRPQEDSAVLKLKGLPYSTTEDDIRTFFAAYNVKEVAFVKEPDGRPSGLVSQLADERCSRGAARRPRLPAWLAPVCAARPCLTRCASRRAVAGVCRVRDQRRRAQGKRSGPACTVPCSNCYIASAASGREPGAGECARAVRLAVPRCRWQQRHRDCGVRKLVLTAHLTAPGSTQALSKNGEFIGERYVRLLHVPKQEMIEQVQLGTLAIPGQVAKMRQRALRQAQPPGMTYAVPGQQLLLPAMAPRLLGPRGVLNLGPPGGIGPGGSYSLAPGGPGGMQPHHHHVDHLGYHGNHLAYGTPDMLAQQLGGLSLMGAGGQGMPPGPGGMPPSVRGMPPGGPRGAHMAMPGGPSGMQAVRQLLQPPSAYGGGPPPHAMPGAPAHGAAAGGGVNGGKGPLTSSTIKIRGLPYKATPTEIMLFFQVRCFDARCMSYAVVVVAVARAIRRHPLLGRCRSVAHAPAPRRLAGLCHPALPPSFADSAPGRNGPHATTLITAARARPPPRRARSQGYQYIPDSLNIGLDSLGRPSGEAWISFASPDEALRAVRELNRHYLSNRYLELSLC